MLLSALTLGAVANQVLAVGRCREARRALGTRRQANVIVGVTIGSATPGSLEVSSATSLREFIAGFRTYHLESGKRVELDEAVEPAKEN